MPITNYIGFVDKKDYILGKNGDKSIRTIASKGFGYTISMNKSFQIVYLDSSYCCDDEDPLELCKCINTLNNYIRDNL